ncbi:MAG: PQQ-binding-like beta-propeller repeat protein [Phycisphaerae bacterium]|nr:PQQ-binding-like beta-propeller repeat protein [Phycisphaerae bacterium]
MIHPVTPSIRTAVFASTLLLFSALSAGAGDWPQWRYDVGHGASTPEALSQELQLQWVRQLPRPHAAWPISQHKLQFDRSYEPMVMGKLIFVPSMVSDNVTAFDTETGQESWRFYTGGPVRFAPVGWQGRLYVVSDDGYLYCLDAEKGTLLWQFRGGPSEYRVLGNERLISMWPARGAPVLEDGTVYFAASIWPFMGTFIHALDAVTGKVVWTNSASASDFILQPHASPAFAGVAPQGYMSVSGDKLLVASGRSVPAVYDRHTGQCLYFHADTKRGGHAVFVSQGWFLNDGRLCQVSDGAYVWPTEATVLDGRAMYGADEQGLIRAESLTLTFKEVVDRRGAKKKQAEFKTLWTRQTEPMLDHIFLKAGSRLYAGNKDGLIAAIEMPIADEESPGRGLKSPKAEISWRMQIKGEPWTMVAADRKLFVVTAEGSLYCFGERASARIYTHEVAARNKNGRQWIERAQQVLTGTGAREGYALVLGAGTGQLLEEIVRQSDLRVIGLDPDPANVDRLRRRFDQAGLYGGRVAILQGSILSTPISPYLASLVVCEDLKAAGYTEDRAEDFQSRVFHVLRPYGGSACLALGESQREAFSALAQAQTLPQASVRTLGDLTLLQRVGPLADSAPWTHQYGDVSNSIFSRDKRVKGPLGLLWFGGSSNVDALPRHGHGPPQQVIGGRLFLQGIKLLSARDVYTGRVIWRKDIPELDTFDMYYDDTFKLDIYDRSYNQEHIPGANAWGSNFVVTDDRLYLITGETCQVMDPATGDTLHEWKLKEKPDIGVPNWGYIGVVKDLLIAGTAPIHIAKEDSQWMVRFNNRFATGSRTITVMNRYTGEVLWERDAVYNFRHNTLIAGADKIFCIDGLSPDKMNFMKRRGLGFEGKPRLLALDARTGEERWAVEDNVFGTWLGYSEAHDVLLQAGASAGDRAPDEVRRGMAAYRGATGAPLWHSSASYEGPPILYHDRIITQTGGSNQDAKPAKTFHLLTGEPVTAAHPLTGDTIPWEWVRFKGCNTAIASEHLLTFRSASAAYVDLSSGLGTTSIGGFKSGCTSNLVAADGVLNAPDYTRTCTCSYQNQTSLAMVHFPANDPWYPDVESWSFDYLPAPQSPQPVKRVGINFGAAGNRTGPDGTLWLEYPSVGGPSPDLPIHVETDQPRLFRRHPSYVAIANDDNPGAFNWVGASGLEGVNRITIRPFVQPKNPDLNTKGQVQAFKKNALNQTLEEMLPNASGSFDNPRLYTVKLYFAEHDNVAQGQRIFDVALQGEKVLEAFDIAAETRESGHCLIKEFKHILIKDTLQVTLVSPAGQTAQPLICGLELMAETAPDAIAKIPQNQGSQRVD